MRLPGGSGPKGRSAASNPANRFTRLSVQSEEPPPEKVPTVYLRDTSRSVISYNDSPDVPFEASLNPYRGCEHGCIYCYARPTHEYLGFSAGLDFETRILVKENAPDILRGELAASAWKPQPLAISGATDPYQPIERRLRLTRGCLEVLVEFHNPTAIVTKNALVTRDLDLLAELARHRAAAAFLSITTLDADLVRRMEPRTSHPRDRLKALSALRAAGIPAGVLVAPVIPGLTDHELPQILAAAADAGAQFAGFIPLRLPGAVAELFQGWLANQLPDRRAKILNRLRSMRGGRLNDPRFGIRMSGEGTFAQQIADLFHAGCRRSGLATSGPQLSTAAFRRPAAGDQLPLFGA